ncbi:MAG: HPr family phosphocarrier protein, partial [Lachnospiraceae bacterium]|nr:HPr family phosphocarrier protein [Lachnospiraceae bacterium]
MIAKVLLGTMQNARKLVSIAERIPYDVELCSGRFVVNAKSMLGVLSMPEFKTGELHVHTDEENECERILEKLLELDLLADTNDAVCRSIYDITVFGEILIDFTWQGVNDSGQTLFAQNPGGAPANVAV